MNEKGKSLVEPTNFVGKKEEITDILTPEGCKSGDYKQGQLLKFNYEGSITCIRITKINRKVGRAWGIHVEPMNYNEAMGHYEHEIDATEDAIREHRVPFCVDCQVPVNQPSTEDGEVKARDRADRTLADGTVIE